MMAAADRPPVAVIAGFGPGLGDALAQGLLREGYTVVGLSRRDGVGGTTDGVVRLCCDVTDPAAVEPCFRQIQAEVGDPDVLIYNAAQLLVKDFMQLTPAEFEAVWRVSCWGAMLCTQQVIPGMVQKQRGRILMTGATASIKGSARFAAFASAKFALRGLAQSLARQYGAQGVHVLHAILDGVIWGERADAVFGMAPEDCMHPVEIAETLLRLLQQPTSAWTHEIDLRPAGEKF